MAETSGPLDAARQKRKALHTAAADLEAAATAPAGAGSWAELVGNRLESVRLALEEHVNEVEGPDGIIARAVDEAPRLDAHAKALMADHARLLERIYSLEDQIETISLDAEASIIIEAREAVLELLFGISRHRQRGSDLVYDAFDVDIGGQA